MRIFAVSPFENATGKEILRFLATLPKALIVLPGHSGKARRRREYDRRAPDSRVEDTDREKEPPAQKGFNPMTGRKM